MSDQYFCAGESCDAAYIATHAEPVSIPVMPNTAENRRLLVRGYGYLVRFQDIETESEALALAVWNGYKFNYQDGRFFSKESEPRLIQPNSKIPAYSRVTGFFRLVDWEA